VAWPVLIKAITSMVLVSIHPFALRRLLLVILALACFSALCFADPVLMVRRYNRENPRAAVLRTAALAQPLIAPALPWNVLYGPRESDSPASVASHPFSRDESMILAVVPVPLAPVRHCEWRPGSADLGRPAPFSFVRGEKLASR
jgi:hypothetical protein